MNKQKLMYEAPEAQTLVIRFESTILTLSGGNPGSAGENLIPGNSWDFGDDD